MLKGDGLLEVSAGQPAESATALPKSSQCYRKVL